VLVLVIATVITFACIAPPWGGLAHSIVQINLESDPARGSTTTTLRLTDSIIGHLTDSLLESIDGGLRQLFGNGGLKAYVEKHS